MTVLAKQSAYTLLSLKNVDELNAALKELGNYLHASGQKVVDEFSNPLSHDSISKEHLTLLRDYKKNGNLALPQAQETTTEPAALAVTDDDVLEIAEITGVDLDIVMSAAAHVEDLEALVLWVEAYKELESTQAIKDSAKQQFELDQLQKREVQLGDRLNHALNKTPVNTALIRQRLGVNVPKSITRLGKWDGNLDSKDAPDFLKSARSAVAKAGIGQK
jgi:hypothetical protein